MLKLPPAQTAYPLESAATQQVAAVEPGALLPEPEVLLIGDSFTNIYSSASLDWGVKAGLGEHLAYHLNAPVDIIATNGAGAAVRQDLQRAARSGRLAAIRAIVYEFAMRDLYVENWPPMPLGEFARKRRKGGGGEHDGRQAGPEPGSPRKNVQRHEILLKADGLCLAKA